MSMNDRIVLDLSMLIGEATRQRLINYVLEGAILWSAVEVRSGVAP
jgi:hypothetical protein